MATILLIDDSKFFASFVTDALAPDGHTVIAAKNGMDANKFVFGAEPPDLILLDVTMPVLDGEKVLLAFRQSPIASKIPVVFFSTKPEGELQALATKHDAKGYIAKPVEPDALRSQINTFLG